MAEMKKINEMIAEYVKEKEERKRAYYELVTRLQKDIDRGYAGAVLAKKTIDERRLRSENTDAWKQKELLEALEKTVEDEKTKLGAVTQITADDLAELTLLEDIELTEKDLTYYISKYQNKPLAIKTNLSGRPSNISVSKIKRRNLERLGKSSERGYPLYYAIRLYENYRD